MRRCGCKQILMAACMRLEPWRIVGPVGESCIRGRRRFSAIRAAVLRAADHASRRAARSMRRCSIGWRSQLFATRSRRSGAAGGAGLALAAPAAC